MTDFTAYLRLGVDSRDAVNAQKDLDRMAAAGDKSDKSFKQLSSTSKLLGASIGGIGLAAATAQVINYADAWTNVSNVLMGVTDSSAAFASTQAKVLALSKDTFSSLDSTARLYSEITRSVSELGVTQEQVIGVTRTINNLFLAGGKSAAAASAAILQLNQGFASGVLRGDEFNSVAEGAPRILDAVSKYLGITRGALRDFAAEGKITAEVLIGALEDYSDEAQKAVDTTTRTFSQSAELARTFALEFVGASDGIKEFSATAGSALVTVAQNLDLVSDAVTVLATAYGARLLSAYAASTAAALARAQVARLETAAYAEQAAREAVLAQQKQAASVAQLKADRDAIASRANSLRSVYQLIEAEQVLAQAKLRSANAEMALEKARYAAQISDKGRILSLSRMRVAETELSQATSKLADMGRDRANVLAQLNAAEKAYAASTAQVLAANKAVSASSAGVVAATGRQAAAIGALSIASRAGALATTAFSGAMALLGGPVGVAILAGAAIYYFATQASEAEKVVEKLNPEVDGLIDRFNALGQAQQQLAREELSQRVKEQSAALDDLNKKLARQQSLLASQDSMPVIGMGAGAQQRVSAGDITNTRAQIEEAEKALTKLQGQFETVKLTTSQINAEMVKFANSFGTLNELAGKFITGDSLSKPFSLFSEGAANLKTFSEEYTKLSADIEKQIALFGDEKKSSELAYLARTGQLKGMSAEEAALLVARYEALEQLKETADKTKELEDAEKSRSESIASSIAELEKQNELFGEQSKYAEILYEINAGLLKVTDAEKSRYLAAAQTNDQLVANKNLADSIDAFAKKSEEDKAALDSIITSVDEFGGAWSRTGSIVADSLGTIGDALSDYSSRMESIASKESQLAEARMKFMGDPKQIEKIAKAEKKLASERTAANLKSFGAIAGAASEMFDEQSKARKTLHGIEMTLSAIEIAMTLKKTAASAVEGVVNQSKGDPYSAFARMAAMAAIMAGLGYAVGGGFSDGGGGGPSAEDIQAAQGTGTVLGDSGAKSESILNSIDRYSEIGLEQLSELRGIRDAMTGLSSGITRLATSLVAGSRFSGAEVQGLGEFANEGIIGDLGAKLLGSSFADPVTSALLGSTKKKLKDSGLLVEAQNLGEILAGDLDVFYYNTIETTKKKMFGLSKKTKTKDELSAADAGLAEQFDQIFTFIGAAVSESVGALGIDAANAIENFNVDIGKVSFKDLSGEEIQSELNAIFSEQADLIAGFVVPAMKEYQQIGEGLFDTLTRVASEMATFNYYVDALDLSLNATGLSAIAAQQSIAEFSGGMDNLSENLRGYYENFYSEEERAASQMKLLTAEMKTLGFDAVPTSREAFRDMVEAIDLTTEAGQKQFAAMLELSSAFADITPAAENAADAAMSLLERSVAAEKKIIGDQISILNSALGTSRSVFNALESSLKSMTISSARTATATRAEAQRQLGAMLSSARGGMLPELSDLNGVLASVAKPSESMFATFEDYATDLYRTANQIRELKDIAGEQVGTDEKALSELQKQSEFLDEIVVWGREQLDIMSGVDTRITSVADALNNLSSIIGVTYPTTEQQKMIAQIAHSSEQSKSEVAAAQERVSQAQAVQQAQIKEIADYVKAALLSIADSTDKTKKVLEKFDAIGMPPVREV